jgi:hypothetical protein
MNTVPDKPLSSRDVPTRAFPLGAVLSITQPRLACDFPDLHELVEFLLDEPVWTVGLVAVAPKCREHLLAIFPFLGNVEMPESVQGEAGVKGWLAHQERCFGQTLNVPRMPPGTISAGGFVGEMERLSTRDSSAGTR